MAESQIGGGPGPQLGGAYRELRRIVRSMEIRRQQIRPIPAAWPARVEVLKVEIARLEGRGVAA